MDENQALSACVCQKCPSFVECGGKIAYCFTGKSTCITDELGCLCPNCPVLLEEGFRHSYYCTRGNESDQT